MNEKSARSVNGRNVRSMAARWVITGEMRLETAAHFGGEGESAVDMAVLRDARGGLPLLPGTSLAGALRSHVADVLAGYLSPECRESATLFGASRSDDAGSQSPLIVFDSLGNLPDGTATEIRDGVAIDRETGTAESGKKFDFEVLPAGTTFPVRVELVVGNAKKESPLVSLLMAALNGLVEDAVSLGMRRSRGLGAVKAGRWKARRYDLANQDGWLAWLTSRHEKPIEDDVAVYDSIEQAIQGACPSLKIEHLEDKRRRVLVDLELEAAGNLLVRSPATDAGAPDTVHLCSAGKPVLPGTGLAGALRAQALRIAGLVREATGDGDRWVDCLFGPQLKDKEKNSENDRARASRLRVSEAFIEGGEARRQTRIAIDRFTGGVVKGGLFEEQVQSGGKLRVRLELRNPCNPEIGLLLLLLKDLLSGEIPVGGAASVGRGVLRGTARVRMPEGTVYEIAANLAVSDEALKAFDSRIRDFHAAAQTEEAQA